MNQIYPNYIIIARQLNEIEKENNLNEKYVKSAILMRNNQVNDCQWQNIVNKTKQIISEITDSPMILLTKDKKII